MNNKTFYLVVGIIFSIIAILHLFRIMLGWEVMLGGLVMPFWGSWLAFALAGYLAVSAHKFWRRA